MISSIEQDQLIAFINRKDWKHSWHLNKTWQGEIDWANTENIKKILGLVLAAINESYELREQACIAGRIVNKLGAEWVLEAENENSAI